MLTNAGKRKERKNGQVHCKNVMSGMKFVWVFIFVACVLQIDDDDDDDDDYNGGTL